MIVARATWSTVADVRDVVGQSGRRRRLLFVRCPWCAELHSHNAAADVIEATRAASCKRGRYRLVMGAAS